VNIRGPEEYFARPRWQDRRGKPPPLTGLSVDALVIDPRLPHPHRTRRRDHLPRLVEAVADHQPMTHFVELAPRKVVLRLD
jgi:hypothetical protein